MPLELLSATVARAPTGLVARDERHLPLAALARDYLQGRDERRRGSGGGEHQGARLASPYVTELVRCCGHAGLHVQRLVACRCDQAQGEARRTFRSASWAAGREGHQPHGRGVLGDARHYEAARRVGGGGQPSPADLVVQGLDGGADTTAADRHVDGESVCCPLASVLSRIGSLACGWTVMPLPTVDLRVPSLPYISTLMMAAELSGLVKCT